MCLCGHGAGPPQAQASKGPRQLSSRLERTHKAGGGGRHTVLLPSPSRGHSGLQAPPSSAHGRDDSPKGQLTRPSWLWLTWPPRPPRRKRGPTSSREASASPPPWEDPAIHRGPDGRRAAHLTDGTKGDRGERGRAPGSRGLCRRFAAAGGGPERREAVRRRVRRSPVRTRHRSSPRQDRPAAALLNGDSRRKASDSESARARSRGDPHSARGGVRTL